MTQKHNHAKAILLALLLVLGMIVSPVSALGYQITAEPLGGVMNLVPGRPTNLSIDVSAKGDAIQRITMDIPTGTVLNFTLFYGNANTVSGWMVYTNDGFFTQYSEVAIGGDAQGYSYWGIEEAGRIDIIGYARNYTTETEYTSGIMVYDALRVWTDHMAYYPVSGSSLIAIYKFEYTSTRPVVVNYYTNTRANVEKAARTTLLGAGSEWIALAQKYAGSTVAFIVGLFWILKFFFIDNLLLVIALWISVSMAYSAITSPNIWGFYKKFFKTQKALLDFILFLWTTFWSILNYLVQIFVKWL
jgi:hypothetical protein